MCTCTFSYVKVEEKRKEDAAAGNEIAIWLEGKVNRKVQL